MADNLNYQPQQKRITEQKANSKEMITEMFSLESQLLLKSQHYTSKALEEGRGGKRNEQKTPQNPNVSLYEKMASSRKHTVLPGRQVPVLHKQNKNYLLPELFKILLVTKSSSVYKLSTTRTSLFHKPILNADEDHPVSSTREDIYKQQWAITNMLPTLEKALASNHRGYRGPYQYSLPAGYLNFLFPLHHRSSTLSFPEQFLPPPTYVNRVFFTTPKPHNCKNPLK